MAIGVPLEVPTTRSISFPNVLQTNNGSTGTLVADADRARALVKDTLKRAKDSTNGDYFAVVKSIQEYLPLLFSLLDGINGGSICVNSSIEVAWGSSFRTNNPLAKTSLKTPILPTKVVSRDLDFDRTMVLFAYAVALIKVAQSSLTELMSSQAAPSDDMSRKWKQNTLHFSSAMSVFRYLQSYPFTGTLASESSKLPLLDVQSSVVGAMHSFCWACLHENIVMRQYSSTKMSTMSTSLLSRVCVFAADKFAATAQQLTSAQDRRVSVMLKWVNDSREYCLALCHLTMALEYGETNKLGLAIGYIDSAMSHLPATGSSNGSASQKQEISSLRDASINIHSYCIELRNRYDRQNRTLTFDPVVKKKEVESSWPSGREVIPGAPEWTPPQQVSSASHTGRQYY